VLKAHSVFWKELIQHVFNFPADLELHMINARVDLRIPNQYMERHRIIQGTLYEVQIPWLYCLLQVGHETRVQSASTRAQIQESCYIQHPMRKPKTGAIVLWSKVITRHLRWSQLLRICLNQQRRHTARWETLLIAQQDPGNCRTKSIRFWHYF